MNERDEAYEVVAEVVPQRPTHVYAWMLRWPVHVLVSGSYMTPEEAFPYRPKASEGVEVRLLKIALPPSEES
ncbi:hypothetical protein HRbin12_01625 [bacterium HR12]|nr:hypothetical protein HRbin12_01625 [bacterium HR12]